MLEWFSERSNDFPWLTYWVVLGVLSCLNGKLWTASSILSLNHLYMPHSMEEQHIIYSLYIVRTICMYRTVIKNTKSIINCIYTSRRLLIRQSLNVFFLSSDANQKPLTSEVELFLTFLLNSMHFHMLHHLSYKNKTRVLWASEV